MELTTIIKQSTPDINLFNKGLIKETGKSIKQFKAIANCRVYDKERRREYTHNKWLLEQTTVMNNIYKDDVYYSLYLITTG